jgi:hypothetical protein
MKYIMILISLLFLYGCNTTGASTTNNSYPKTEIIRMYDKDHHFVGYKYINKYRTRVYDKDHHLVGYERNTSYGTRYYDKDHHFIGYSK